MGFAQWCANDQDLNDKQKTKTDPQKGRVIDLELEERFNIIGEDAKTYSDSELHWIRGKGTGEDGVDFLDEVESSGFLEVKSKVGVGLFNVSTDFDFVV